MRKRIPLIDRLMAKVTVDPATGCWIFTGKRNNMGYGLIRRGPARDGWILAHRAAYELHVAPIPDGMDLRHLVCDNPPCCNPAHCTPGTRKQNVADMDSRGRRRYVRGNGGHPPRYQGETHPRATITEAVARAIKERPVYRGMRKDLMREFGVSETLIKKVRSGKIWAHL